MWETRYRRQIPIKHGKTAVRNSRGKYNSPSIGWALSEMLTLVPPRLMSTGDPGFKKN